MSKTVIKKRNRIDNSIIAELNEKYPDCSEKNGISYSRDLKYITFEPNVDFDADIIAFDSEIGFGTFNVIIYFSEQMMRNGYKVKISGNNWGRQICMCSSAYGVPIQKVQQIVEFLISINYLFRISDGKDEYLTTAQAVYDYERCMHTRAEERKRKAKSREKYKRLTENNSISQQSSDYQGNENNADFDDNELYCEDNEKDFVNNQLDEMLSSDRIVF